jgi:SH3 domain
MDEAYSSMVRFFLPTGLENVDLCGNSVRALYDYTATIPEEFDFQANDIIAVTATPEDGWWSGELLDENRRVPGRHIFPSNFVHLF